VERRYRKVMSAQTNGGDAASVPPPVGTRTIRVLGAVLALAGLLAAADTVLVRFGVSERKADAGELYSRAQELYSAGRYSSSLDLYRQARNEERNNFSYQVALIRALQHSEHMEEAEAEATRLITDHPNDGYANLVMARLLAFEKRYSDAASFYHRALYGSWPGSDSQRTHVRLELADMLSTQGLKEQVVAEVLLLLNEAGNDVEILRRSADLMLKSGAWSRAATVYDELAASFPNDPGVHAGYGLALFGNREYRRARGELALAVRLGEPKYEIQQKLETSRAVIDLDPHARGVSSGELERRRLVLLNEVLEISTACGSDPASPALVAARELTEKRHKQHAEPEDEFDAAQSAWESLPTHCKTGPKAEAISILFAATSSSAAVRRPHPAE